MKVLICGLAVSGVMAPALAEQSLEQAASDPTASLMNVQVSDWYTASYHNLNDESGNTVLLRSAIPFTLAGHNNIFRVSTKFIFPGPG
tara:strand:- start:229200 stop:229463 length:264 start_codon:yes stop_codon:yes gene_type:complete